VDGSVLSSESAQRQLRLKLIAICNPQRGFVPFLRVALGSLDPIENRIRLPRA